MELAESRAWIQFNPMEEFSIACGMFTKLSLEDDPNLVRISDLSATETTA